MPEDAKIKDRGWQFPKLKENVAARLPLATLIGIIKERSGSFNPAQTAAAAAVRHTQRRVEPVEMEL